MEIPEEVVIIIIFLVILSLVLGLAMFSSRGSFDTLDHLLGFLR